MFANNLKQLFTNPAKFLGQRSLRSPRRAGLIAMALLIGALTLSSCGNSPESIASAPPATDAELEQQVLEIIRQNPDVILEAVQIADRQRREQQEVAQREKLEQIKNDPEAAIGKAPVIGAENAEVIIIEFSDFQCPFCSRTQPTLKALLAKYPDDVSLAYKHLPLARIHDQAIPAAKASWAAQQQGKFWEYHDALFENQANLSEEYYLALATELELDLDQFNSDRNSEAAETAINTDLAMAEELGATGTPFFVVNGVPVFGALDLADFEQLIAEVRADN
ncbi:DSBA oxidoreductase [Thalassoporum mexicanum PCC 7367]|uniref:DsbA family protein n=1 Tax=Thalassoporum mexicanum TaxID=3457544 RepID=UPI00029F9147|nr:DsbA family protein [Pseudanabaena sp. PCC 7367]AFY71256.1 DSBA oxidoreductase [Pseudanabaena sp. PCC 7367]